MRRTSHARFIILAVVAYAIAASAWILFSDNLMGLLLDPASMTRFATIKGLGFVAVTAVGLGALLHLVPEQNTPRRSSQAAGRMTGTRLSVFLAKLILLCVVPLLLIATGLSIAAIDRQKQETDLTANHLASDLALDIDKDLGGRISGLEMLAASDRPDLAFYTLAQGYRQSFGSHVVLAEAGDPMRMLLNTRVPFGAPLPPLPRPTGRAAAPQALATGKAAVGDTFTGPVSQQRLLAIAVPVTGPGAPTRVVLTTLEASYFQNHLDWEKLPAGWALFLRDSLGERIAARVPADWEDATASGPTARFIAHTTRAEWSVEVEIPQQIRRAPFLAAGLLLALGVVGATAVSVLGGMMAGRALGRQVAILAEPSGTGAAPTIAEIADARLRLDQAAAAVRETQERFRLLFDRAPLALGFTANDGRILARNTHFEQLFGYSDADLPTIEDWWQKAYPDPDYRGRILAQWDEAVARARDNGGSEIDPMECWITCDSGRERLIQISAIALPDGILAMFLDVTERRRAEEVLRDSEYKYRLLADHAADCIVWTTPDQRIHYISPASQQVFGHAPEEFEADPDLMASILHPADADAYINHLESGCAGHVEDLEFRVVLPDGAERWVAHRCWPVHDGQGRYLGRHAINRDITLLKAQARALSESEARYRSILDHAADAVFIAESTGRYVYANHRAGELLGYAPEELLRLSIPDITPPEDAEHAAAAFNTLKGDGHLHTELLLKRKNGSRVPVEINAIMLPDGTAYGACRDISERRQAERQLRNLSQAIEQTPLSVIVTRLDGAIEYVNESFVALSGYGREETLGRNPRFLASGHTPPEIYASLWSTLSAGRSWKGEFLNRHKDGSEHVELAIVSPVRNRLGDVVGYVAIQEDITEKKRLGEELTSYRRHLEEMVDEKQRTANLLQRTVDRLTVANAELERIAVVAAHDLREPARAVSMYAQMLERHSKAALDQDGLDYLHYLMSGAQRIYALIGGLLDYSRAPASAGELGRVSSANACAAALAALAAEISARNAEIVVGPLPEVIGDEAELLQVFQNLLDNALKFRNPACRLRVDVSAERRGAQWRFTVADNGIGFDPGSQDVFELFRQLNTHGTGIGAGLAICKRTVLRLGGDIWVDSRPGHGSAFTFTLPAAE